MDGPSTGSAAAMKNAPAANGKNGAAAFAAPPRRPMQQEIEPHVEAWENFVALTKWSTIGIIVILVLLAAFLL